MKRKLFVRNLLGIGLFSALGCRMNGDKTATTSTRTGEDLSQNKEAINRLRGELIEAWHKSEKMTMTNVNQMPPEFFTFKYTNEAMTFSEQWRHCVIYTWGQLAGRAGIKTPTRISNFQCKCLKRT